MTSENLKTYYKPATNEAENQWRIPQSNDNDNISIVVSFLRGCDLNRWDVFSSESALWLPSLDQHLHTGYLSWPLHEHFNGSRSDELTVCGGLLKASVSSSVIICHVHLLTSTRGCWWSSRACSCGNFIYDLKEQSNILREILFLVSRPNVWDRLRQFCVYVQYSEFYLNENWRPY